MSQIIELTDSVYGALKQIAQAAGVTPQAWIAARLAESKPAGELNEGATASPVKTMADFVESDHGAPPKTMADLFAGRLGRIRTGNKNLSEQGSVEFAKDLEAKRRAGHL